MYVLYVLYVVWVGLGGKYISRDSDGEVYITLYYDTVHALSWGCQLRYA